MPPPKSPNLVNWVSLIASAFMAIIGFLGFLGWLSDSSNQKWWALLCSLIGAVGVAVFWKLENISKEEAASVSNADEEIKLKSVESQRNYWEKERRATLISTFVIATFLALIWIFWNAARDYYFLFGYVCLTTLWAASKRLHLANRELNKLARQ